MPQTTLDEILSRLSSAQQELEVELERLLKNKQQQFHYQLRKGKVIFERNIRRLQRQQRDNAWNYLKKAPLKAILSAPIIYGVLIPMILLDFSVTFYQHSCFRIYGIPIVGRSQYFIFDRHRLAYLNSIEAFNCIYCGYGNGLIEYTREIFARTEQFWCPIKHAQKTKDPHHRVQKFFDYGDVDALRSGLKNIRQDWSSCETCDFSNKTEVTK